MHSASNSFFNITNLVRYMAGAFADCRYAFSHRPLNAIRCAVPQKPMIRTPVQW